MFVAWWPRENKTQKKQSCFQLPANQKKVSKGSAAQEVGDTSGNSYVQMQYCNHIPHNAPHDCSS